MTYSIFDIETDGLLDDVTKIHCMSVNKVTNGKEERFTITDYPSIRHFIEREEILVGHNIVQYDVPVLRKILGVNIKARLIDTLGVAWYLTPNRASNGLESWGETLGIAKPIIKDWQNLTKAEYIHRCESDVSINTLLFNEQVGYLRLLYDGVTDQIDRLFNYITFKLDCAREQYEVRWKLDIEKAKAGIIELEKLKQERVDALSRAIPDKVVYKKVEKPKVTTKKDGNLSEHGKRWQQLLESIGLPPDHPGPITIEQGREPGNPTSHDQLKKWLYDLGWEPSTFKFVKDKKAPYQTQPKKIPQLSTLEGFLCNSVKLLYEKEPALENLDGLFILNHRIGLLNGFLRDVDKDGFMRAEVVGFTNTMRFMHSKVVNLPKVSRPYGDIIRGCLTVPDPEKWLLCGADVSGLEDTTKQHYIYFFDPEYVKQMRVPGFDPHLDIAILAGMLTDQQVSDHKLYDQTKGKEGKSHKKERGDAKKVNFMSVYGAGPPKISLETGWPIAKSKSLHEVYWKRNRAVKQVADACTTKVIRGQMWLWNPVSRLWYSLRFDKDKFSTLNQGTGVYCFDVWVRHQRLRGIRLCGQFHDEVCFPLLKEEKERVRDVLLESMKAANEELKLNVELSISIDFGLNYSETH